MICDKDTQDLQQRETELEHAFHTAMTDTDAELDVAVGAQTHISNIHRLALHVHEDPELLRLANKWFVEVAALNRHMHQYWTVPEQASLVALLDRFKAVLHHLLNGVIVHSVFVPALRQPIAHQRARIKKLFVGDSQVAFEQTRPLHLADIHR